MRFLTLDHGAYLALYGLSGLDPIPLKFPRAGRLQKSLKFLPPAHPATEVVRNRGVTASRQVTSREFEWG